MIRTLLLAGDPQLASLEPWLDYLRSTDRVSVTVVRDAEALVGLPDYDVLVAHPGDASVDPTHERAICDFIERGGGLVGLHCTNARWAGMDRFRRLAGAGVEGQLPQGEIVSEVCDREHDITRRLSGSLVLRDSCYAQPQATEASFRVLLETTWRFHRLPVAYVRAAGRGRVFFFGLGESARTFQATAVQELLYRGLRHVAGHAEAGPVQVGLIGYGAIAEEHVGALEAVAGVELRSICDRSPGRLAVASERSPEAVCGADAAELLADPAVEVAVISTPPNTHAQMARMALQSGKHVVVEKPFCFSAAEADQLVRAAESAERTLTVYQNRRWDPDFLALERVVREGALGHLFHLETFVGGYSHPCHFWHSDAGISGGVIYDWGAHYLDWILQLIPDRVVRVDASRQKLIWHDVTNDDHFDLRLRFSGGAEAQFTHSDIAAAPKPKWYVLGTKGAAVGRWRERTMTTRAPGGGLAEERLLPTDLPCELHVLTPDGHGGSHDQTLSLPPRPSHAFYRNLAGHLLAGEPLAVPARSARRNIAVMEAALQAAEQGSPVAVDI